MDILRILLARGADIGWKDRSGQNSLQGDQIDRDSYDLTEFFAKF
jgi:hypothetical protein